MVEIMIIYYVGQDREQLEPTSVLHDMDRITEKVKDMNMSYCTGNPKTSFVCYADDIIILKIHVQLFKETTEK